ncbi:MAG: sulfotransferase family 2 domain-containing protein, partial [Ginsengibacter sp.]
AAMVITDKFVYIHKPKTGGTFVTDALIKLYDGKWNLLLHAKLALLKEIHFKNRVGKLIINAPKHGGCLEIPEKYKDRSIVSTIRNPFDYYVSQYEFGWWKRNHWLKYYKNIESFNERFSSFPNISFSQFMELMCAVFNDYPHNNFHDETSLGRYTVEFVNDHFYDPKIFLKKGFKKFANNEDYKQNMFPVKFIFTHRLNQQLYEYLIDQGFLHNDVEFILKKEKVLPQGKGRTNEQKWEKYYSNDLKELVRKKDWLLFELFPEFDTM